VYITVLKELHFPNAFSPNGDGINEKWEIPGLSGYPQSRIEVFNRREQSVFRSNGYSSPWDGRMNGKPLPADVYYYIITTGINGVGRQSGTVMLLR
jgi:gliding motility-associated-like protein